MIHRLSILILPLWILPLQAATTVPVDELAMARAEAQAYREAWLELKRRDELLGVAALSPEVHDAQDKVARLSGELIRTQKHAEVLAEKSKQALVAAVRWAGENDGMKKAAARAEFESAQRELTACVQAEQEARPLASGVTDAQVVAVDRKQQSLVLNLGRVQGAREGMPFRILRGDKVIGSCRLIEVRELVSAGLTEQLQHGNELKVGDRAAILAEK